MLRVSNGFVTLRVTSGAFRSIYSDRGFHIVDDQEAPKTLEGVSTQAAEDSCEEEDSSQEETTEEEDSEEDEEPEDESDDEEDEEDEPELSEIPLSEMGFEQLQRYAEQLGLDYSSIRSKKELRILIRGHLQQ